jgi:hypothetical protein
MHISNANLDNAMIGNHVYFDGDFTSISIGDYSVIAKFSNFWFCNLRRKSYFVLILERLFQFFATDSQIKKNFKSGSSGGY